MVYYIVFISRKFELIHKITLIIVGLFCIGQFLTYSKFYNFTFHFFKGNIYFFNRYLYILIFIIFVNALNIKKAVYKKAYDYLEIILLINCVFVLLGLLLDINIFKSYESSPRFGYVGLFSKPEEAGFIYAITIIYNYYFWVLKKNYAHLIKTLLFILTISVFGQKKMLLFLSLLIGMHLLYYFKYKNVFRIIILPIISLIFFLRIEIVNYVLQYSSFWSNIYKEKGLLSAITSTRSDLFNNALFYIKKNWNISNYIFGSLDFDKYKVEFEMVDLYFFMGVWGLFFYFYLIREHYFKNSDFLKKKLIIILLTTSFFGGGLLLSVTATLLFYLVINKIMINSDNV